MRFRISNLSFLRSDISNSIEEYSSWKSTSVSGLAAKRDNEILKEFVSFTGVKSLDTLSFEHIEAYRLHIALTGSRFRVSSSLRSINCFLRYFRARNHDCIDPVTYTHDELLSMSVENKDIMSKKDEVQKRRVGRPSVDDQVIEKIKFLKDNEHFPLSFREIGRAIKKNEAQVCRLYNRSGNTFAQ